jgi:signal transduction histidine kinase
MDDSYQIPDSSILMRSWGRRVLILAAWTVPAVLFAVLSHARMVALEQESSLWIRLADHLASWYTWAAIAPGIVWLGRRFRLDRAPRGRSLLVHLVAGVAVALVHSAAATFASITLFGEPVTWAHWYETYIRWLAWSSPWSLVIYWIVLAVSYAWDYYGRARSEQLRASQLESQFAKAQLEALKQQLQPHFLFNTLNSISVLMQKGDVAGSTSMVFGLSDLLRYTLNRDGQQEVPLSDELEFTRRYLEIEQTRFGERLRVNFEVDPDTFRCRIPVFLLQLLVENAIRHGIAKKAGEGQVTITTSLSAGRLRISVEDDGVGLGNGERDEPEGIGIRNARQRLSFLYGNDFRLELTERRPAGVIATLEIPAVDPGAVL